MQHSASRSATRVWENPPPQGRKRFLTKSWIGVSILAASFAPEARAGRRLRRARAKAAMPPLAIGAHLPDVPVDISARKLLLVALRYSILMSAAWVTIIRTHSFCIWNSKIVRSACFAFDFMLVDKILVDKIVRFHSCWQEFATKCSEKTESVVEGKKTKKFKFIKTVMSFCNDLNMLHALRRAYAQQSNDQGETDSDQIDFMPRLAFFRKCLAFY